ncbi:2-isopropylmalate synthase [bacterium]|nr:2-isopropylmalate synthase [candidate division CSSED10-310 bacterium]
MEDRVIIFDTTLRDGEQSPGCSMNVDQKIQMAKQLERLGVDVIEAGFPIASEGDFESVKRIARTMKKCSVAGLSRTTKKDIDCAWDALKYAKKPRIHTFVATSDIHMKHKLRKTRSEVLEMAVECVRYAKSLTKDVEFSAEDAVRSDLDFLCKVIEAVIDAGAVVVNIPDTVGYSIPEEFGSMILSIKKNVSNIDRAVISVHCHNDLGLGVANSIAAIQNGARQVECTVNGIGERAGNASLEEIVMTIHTRKDLIPLKTNVNTKELYRSSQLLSNLTGMYVQRNKAIVGANAFAHEAGIHQDGMLKHAQTYEIMTPQSVGFPQSMLVLGKHSGRHALAKRYAELGYKLSKEELNTVYNIFTRLADKKKDIYDADLIAIVQDEVSHIAETFIFEGIQVLSGSKLTPTATVRLRKGDKCIEESSIGDGPVDATCRAIDKITKVKARLTSYSIKGVTTGKDAMGEVIVQVEFNKTNFIGRAASTDVVEASAKAYLNAVNRVLNNQKTK